MAPVGGKDGQEPHAEQVPRVRPVSDLDVERSRRASQPVVLVFRRRCGWCGVYLRAWQMNLCQLCGPEVRDRWPWSPCDAGARWDAEPDRWRWPSALAATGRFARRCWVTLNEIAY